MLGCSLLVAARVSYRHVSNLRSFVAAPAHSSIAKAHASSISTERIPQGETGCLFTVGTFGYILPHLSALLALQELFPFKTAMEPGQGYKVEVRNTFINISEVGEFRRQISAPSQLEPITSLIIQELGWCSFQDLREFIDSEGFQGTYDFLYLGLPTAFEQLRRCESLCMGQPRYLPMKLQLGIPFGHAFLNFVTPEIAKDFREHVDGLAFRGKRLKVGSQLLQGKEALIARYRNSPVMHESVAKQWKPTLFQLGEEMAFPRPTKHVKPPKCRACRNKMPADWAGTSEV